MVLSQLLHLDRDPRDRFFPRSRSIAFAPLPRRPVLPTDRSWTRNKIADATTLYTLGHGKRHQERRDSANSLASDSSLSSHSSWASAPGPSRLPSPAWIALEERLMQPRGVQENKASQNNGKGMETVVGTRYTRQPWEQLFDGVFQAEYEDAIRSLQEVLSYPQTMRLLEHEADVGDIVFSNILTTVVDILNRLLHPRYRDRLEIVIQHQAIRTVKMTKYSKKQNKDVAVAVPVRVDHAIVLVQKDAVLRENKNPEARATRVYLVIVEEKRYGYLHRQEWLWDDAHVSPREYISQRNVKAHLHQLTLYMRPFNCQHFLLTDYKDGVAIHLKENPSDQTRGDPTVQLTPYPAQSSFRADSKALGGNRSTRHALCMLGTHAMQNLGVLNAHFSTAHVRKPSRKGKEPEVQHHPLISDVLAAHKRHGHADHPQRTGHVE